MKRFTVIVAGGSGTRMNHATPKQFIPLLGEPILMHTIRRFHDFDSDMKLIVVLPQAHMETWNTLCQKHNFDIQHDLVSGGAYRFNSVKNGLDHIDEEGLVAVHDGVRPLVSLATIQQLFDQAAESTGAVPVLPIAESVRQETTGGTQSIDRSKLMSVQTPQVFQSGPLKEAFEQPFDEQFTDEASVMESVGHVIEVVPGNRENIKITTPLDLTIAEAILSQA